MSCKEATGEGGGGGGGASRYVGGEREVCDRVGVSGTWGWSEGDREWG